MPNQFTAAWSKQEDEQVLAQAISDRALSAEIGRSICAIQTRRYNLKRELGLPPYHGPEHGVYRYSRGCRCDLCVSAAAEKRRYYSELARQKSPEEIPHGTPSGYIYHKCRCDKCRQWKRVSSRMGYDPERASAYRSRYHSGREDRLERKRISSREWRSRPETKADQRRHNRAAEAREARAPRERTGEPWTLAEDSIVLREDITQLEMGYMLHRSVGSIGARRRKLKLRKEQAACLLREGQGVDVGGGEAVSDVVQRAKAALRGATEGPWDYYIGEQCCGGTCVDNGHGLPLHSGGDLLPSDAMFIAAARSLVPELVAEVERLHGLLVSASDEAKSLRKQLADKPKARSRGW